MGKFDVGAFAFTMVLLYIGGLVANFLVPYLPFSEGYISGIVIGMVQMLMIVVFGLATRKFDLWSILTGGIIIFIGGLLGGMLVGYIKLDGLAATILVLAVQTAILMTFGLIKSRGKSKPKL